MPRLEVNGRMVHCDCCIDGMDVSHPISFICDCGEVHTLKSVTDDESTGYVQSQACDICGGMTGLHLFASAGRWGFVCLVCVTLSFVPPDADMQTLDIQAEVESEHSDCCASCGDKSDITRVFEHDGHRYRYYQHRELTLKLDRAARRRKASLERKLLDLIRKGSKS